MTPENMTNLAMDAIENGQLTHADLKAYLSELFNACLDDYDAYVRELATLRAQRDTMREALEPFAKEAANWANFVSDDERPLIGKNVTVAEFTIGDLRAALAAAAPDWEDLKGKAPNATGDLSSEAFVRELRDDWI